MENGSKNTSNKVVENIEPSQSGALLVSRLLTPQEEVCISGGVKPAHHLDKYWSMEPGTGI